MTLFFANGLNKGEIGKVGIMLRLIPCCDGQAVRRRLDKTGAYHSREPVS